MITGGYFQKINAKSQFSMEIPRNTIIWAKSVKMAEKQCFSWCKHTFSALIQLKFFLRIWRMSILVQKIWFKTFKPLFWPKMLIKTVFSIMETVLILFRVQPIAKIGKVNKPKLLKLPSGPRRYPESGWKTLLILGILYKSLNLGISDPFWEVLGSF